MQFTLIINQLSELLAAQSSARSKYQQTKLFFQQNARKQTILAPSRNLAPFGRH